MNPLQLRPEDCSEFGCLVLRYLERHPQTNMSQLAQKIGITRAGIGLACLKRCTPNEETATKIALGINAEFREVARLVHENKLDNLANPDGLDYIADFSKALQTRKIPVADAIRALNAVFEASCELRRSLPEADRPSDFYLYKRAFEYVRADFLTRSKLAKAQTLQVPSLPESLALTE